MSASSIRLRALHTPCSADYMSAKATTFFWDTPWGNVPRHRLGPITVEPRYLGGGLLGGSSKLAALAAKRKQKQEEAASAAKAGDTKAETDKAVALLDKLSVKGKDPTPFIRGGVCEPQRRPVQRYPARKRSPSPPPAEPEVEEASLEPAQPAIEFLDLRAKPSMFASTLCGTEDQVRKRQKLEVSSFPLPYTTFQGYSEAKPFAGPSPDDIVLRAQARGAGHG